MQDPVVGDVSEEVQGNAICLSGDNVGNVSTSSTLTKVDLISYLPIFSTICVSKLCMPVLDTRELVHAMLDTIWGTKRGYTGVSTELLL